MAEVNKTGNEQEIGNSVEENGNSLTFEDKVIKKIVGFAASEIPGIIAMSGNLLSGIADRLKSSEDPTKGISVEVGKKQVAIDMKVICEYGQDMQAIFQNIVDRVSTAIKDMTGLDVAEINVHVVDILLKEDFDRKKGIETKAIADEEQLLDDARRVE